MYIEVCVYIYKIFPFPSLTVIRKLRKDALSNISILLNSLSQNDKNFKLHSFFKYTHLHWCLFTTTKTVHTQQEKV